MAIPVVLVHGWSVHNTNTYGGLAKALEVLTAQQSLDIDISQIWLGKYISFQDEVKLADISRALEAAVQETLGALIASGQRFAVVTHSTGGPVVRDWWQRYYQEQKRPCPMSHLIMLAPANFGSALAQLGKSSLSRISSFFDGGVEPGVGVLDWLELGSPEAFRLNQQWIAGGDSWRGSAPVYPFVLSGQSIDHKLYDHVNSYTGELGSDGVVRAAAANLNSNYLRLTQSPMQPVTMLIHGARKNVLSGTLAVAENAQAPATAFGLMAGRSHSGTRIGIMRSVKANATRHPTLDAIIRCLRVTDTGSYKAAVQAFADDTAQLGKTELLDIDKRWLGPDHVRIRDPHCMAIFRVSDDQGNPVAGFDLLLLGPGGDPNRLPPGLIRDRQRNKRATNTLTLYFNHSILNGSPAVIRHGEVLRPALQGVSELGLRIIPHQLDGFAHYGVAELAVSAAWIDEFLKPHQTLLVDVVLRRVVRKNTTQLTQKTPPEEFKGTLPGDPIADSLIVE